VHRGISGTAANLLGRTERSSPKAAQRRAVGVGLDGEGARQATMAAAAMSLCLGKDIKGEALG